MRLAVIGTDHIGLVAGACFADSGHDVVCVGTDERVIESLQRGVLPFYEEGLSDIVQRCAREELLSFTTDLTSAVRQADIVFITVGTPVSEDGKPDLSAFLEVVNTVAHAASGPTLLVLKSMVPVGTNARVRGILKELGATEIEVASNPEFIKQGTAVHDFRRPDRVVLGVHTERAGALLHELYEPFVRTGAPILFMDPASAELTSLASNAMLAMRISFMNAIARLCEGVGADVEHVRRATGADRRIGSAFLFAGAGYGGTGLPEAVESLAISAREEELSAMLFEAIQRTNASQKHLLVEKIEQAFDPFGGLKGRTIAIWGLAYKGNTDDLCGAPSLVLIEELIRRGVHIRAHDPVATPRARKQLSRHANAGSLFFAQTMYEATIAADAVAIVNDWNQYRRPDFVRLRQCLRQPWVFDGRNLWDPQQMSHLGFQYRSVGRRDVTSESRDAASAN